MAAEFSSPLLFWLIVTGYLLLILAWTVAIGTSFVQTGAPPLWLFLVGAALSVTGVGTASVS